MQLHLEISVVTTGIKAPRYRAEVSSGWFGFLQQELKSQKKLFSVLVLWGGKKK